MGHPVLLEGEEHGLSVFFRLDDAIFQTYATYARGTVSLTDIYRLLDTTPYARQQAFKDSPAGWAQNPTYGPPVTKPRQRPTINLTGEQDSVNVPGEFGFVYFRVARLAVPVSGAEV